jgi:hypothetical protein
MFKFLLKNKILTYIRSHKKTVYIASGCTSAILFLAIFFATFVPTRAFSGKYELSENQHLTTYRSTSKLGVDYEQQNERLVLKGNLPSTTNVT